MPIARSIRPAVALAQVDEAPGRRVGQDLLLRVPLEGDADEIRREAVEPAAGGPVRGRGTRRRPRRTAPALRTPRWSVAWAWPPGYGREAEVDDVAVADRVVLALQADFAVIAAGRERAARDQVVVRHDLGPDEAALDVGVDLARGQLRVRVAGNRPRAALVLADREERDVAEQVVARADDAVEPGLLQAEIGHERGARPRSPSSAISSSILAHSGTAPCGGRLQERPQPGERPPPRSIGGRSASSMLMTSSSGLADRNWKPRRRLRSSPARPSVRSGVPSSSARRHASSVSCSFFSSGGRGLLEVLLEPIEPAFDDTEVREDQFVLHRLRVAGGIDRPGRVRHAVVPEQADNVQQGVRVAERRHVEEVLRAAAVAGAGDVGKLHGRGGGLPRGEHRREPRQALVGHAGNADVRLGLAVMGRARRFARARQEAEKGALAGGAETDEAST